MSGGIEASVSSTDYPLRRCARNPVRFAQTGASAATPTPHHTSPKSYQRPLQRSLIGGDQGSGSTPVLLPLIPMLRHLMVHGPGDGCPT